MTSDVVDGKAQEFFIKRSGVDHITVEYECSCVVTVEQMMMMIEAVQKFNGEHSIIPLR